MTFYIAPLENRAVLEITGADRQEFLQGISSNDVSQVAQDNAVYTCFLTPQGKFLYDMFLVAQDDDTWLADVEKDSLAALLAHMNKYKLRADVSFDVEENTIPYVFYGGAIPATLYDEATVYSDPRMAEIGWRGYVPKNKRENLEEESLKVAGEFVGFDDYDSFRLSLGVPDGRRDITPEKMHLIEANMEQLSGVAFDKGCFTGQELTARVHNRGLVKKRLLPIRLDFPVAVGDTVTNLDGEAIGHVTSQNNRYAMAHVKLELARPVLAGADKAQIDGSDVELFKPDWLNI